MPIHIVGFDVVLLTHHFSIRFPYNPTSYTHMFHKETNLFDPTQALGSPPAPLRMEFGEPLVLERFVGSGV